MIRTILAGAMLAFAVSAHAGQSGCEPITVEQFTALKMGSSYAEAVELFGCEGEEMSRIEMAVPQYPSMQMKTTSSVVYVWRNSDLSSVVAMFIDDRLARREQIGLANAGRRPNTTGRL